MYYDKEIAAHEAALKHGVEAYEAIWVAHRYLEETDLDDADPSRQLRIGFGPSGDLIEVIVLRFDSRREMVIHAMRARRHLLGMKRRRRN